MSTVRQRRLTNEYAELQDYARAHPRIRISQIEGSPPERYELVFRISSVAEQNGEIVPAKDHRVEIALTRNFPRTPPTARVLTPLFHPNIVGDGQIQFEEHWTDETSLTTLVMRIGELLAYQRYQIAGASNLDAVDWISRNIDRLPLDEVNLRISDESTDEVSKVKAKPQAETTPSLNVPFISPSPDSIKLTCPECSASYYVRSSADGKKVQCKRCRKVFLVKF